MMSVLVASAGSYALSPGRKKEKSETLKIETRVPQRGRTKTLSATGCVCLHPCHFLNHHGKHKPPQLLGENCTILLNYMVAHMADRGPRTKPTVHQTPVCRVGGKCFQSPSRRTCWGIKEISRFRKEKADRSHRGDPGCDGEARGADRRRLIADAAQRADSAASAAAVASAAQSIQEQRGASGEEGERAGHATTETQRRDLHATLFTLADIYKRGVWRKWVGMC